MSKIGKALRAPPPKVGKIGRGLAAPKVRPGLLGGALTSRKIGATQARNLGRTLVTDISRTASSTRMRGRPVDLMSALSLAKNLPNARIAVGKLTFETDKRKYELPLAHAVAAQIRVNIQEGKNPSGRTSKPLRPETLRKREGTGPRGIETGAMVASIRVVDSGDHVSVAIDQVAPGQFKRAFRGARWTYNPTNTIVRAALEALVDVLLGGGGDNG